MKNGDVMTNGGRVLCAVGVGETIGQAQRQAHGLADAIRWEGARYRRDIGYRAVERKYA